MAAGRHARRKANHAWVLDPTGTADPAGALAEMIARTPRQESALSAVARLGGEPRPTKEPPHPEPPAAPDDPVAKVTRRLDALQRESRSPGRSLGL